jgi:hypothetical protein
MFLPADYTGGGGDPRISQTGITPSHQTKLRHCTSVLRPKFAS